mmetsp:Transcript_5549/g.13805  ORF Transcript_5549/g.13805 Transcript_5549/m.13805 type:complete len:231 (-) Transcript_5549:548-1240(-)
MPCCPSRAAPRPSLVLASPSIPPVPRNPASVTSPYPLPPLPAPRPRTPVNRPIPATGSRPWAAAAAAAWLLSVNKSSRLVSSSIWPPLPAARRAWRSARALASSLGPSHCSHTTDAALSTAMLDQNQTLPAVQYFGRAPCHSTGWTGGGAALTTGTAAAACALLVLLLLAAPAPGAEATASVAGPASTSWAAPFPLLFFLALLLLLLPFDADCVVLLLAAGMVGVAAGEA